MANYESFKDVRTVASISALVAVGISSSYFLSELSKIKEEQAEMKKHLAAIIPIANPDMARQINNALQAVKLLDTRVAKAQEDIKIIAETAQSELPDQDPTKKRVYRRLTKRQKDNSNSVSFARPVVTSPVSRIREEDIDEDVKAMM